MKVSLFKRGRVAVASGYVMGAWIYGLLHVVSNSDQFNYIGGNVWSILWRALSWPYWVVLAVI